MIDFIKEFLLESYAILVEIIEDLNLSRVKLFFHQHKEDFLLYLKPMASIGRVTIFGVLRYIKVHNRR